VSLGLLSPALGHDSDNTRWQLSLGYSPQFSLCFIFLPRFFCPKGKKTKSDCFPGKTEWAWTWVLGITTKQRLPAAQPVLVLPLLWYVSKWVTCNPWLSPLSLDGESRIEHQSKDKQLHTSLRWMRRGRQRSLCWHLENLAF